MKINFISFSISAALALGLMNTANADVRGLNKNQLAQFANQSVNNLPGTYIPIPQVAQRQVNINRQVTPIEKDVVLMQLGMLDDQGNNSVKGFTTVNLRQRKSVNSVVESKVQTKEEIQQVESSTATFKSNDRELNQPNLDDQDEKNWMLKVAQSWEEKRRVQAQAERQLLAQQQNNTRRNIQVGNFGSAQVQYASFSPNNYSAGSNFSSGVYTGENIVRPTTSTAPTIGNDQFYAKGPATIQCVIQAANKHHVPVHVLLGVASMENGNNGQTMRNRDASHDMGHFQLNTIHFRRGGAFSHINLEDARWRGCYNAELAAWHLNRQLTNPTKQNVNFWVRAAGYHSWTPSKASIYIRGNGKSKGLIAYSQDWLNWLNKNQQYLAQTR